MTTCTAVQRPAGGLGKAEVQLFSKNSNSSFSQMGPATCSEVLTDVLRVEHDGWLLGDMLCKLAEDGNMHIIHIESAGSETGKCCGETEFVSALLYHLRQGSKD